jgi:two-component system sensor histidine kinase DegS
VVVLGQPRPLLPPVDVTLFRAVQESVNNANKHSQSTKVEIKLNFTDPKIVVLSVFDNGVGTESAEGGFGLIGMKERVRLIQGELRIQSEPGQGFLVEIIAPG